MLPKCQQWDFTSHGRLAFGKRQSYADSSSKDGSPALLHSQELAAQGWGMAEAENHQLSLLGQGFATSSSCEQGVPWPLFLLFFILHRCLHIFKKKLSYKSYLIRAFLMNLGKLIPPWLFYQVVCGTHCDISEKISLCSYSNLVGL
jgi:hypothetical protein